MRSINLCNWIFFENRPIRSLQLANIIRFVSSFLVGVILIKGGLDIELVGKLEFFLFFSALLSAFWIQGAKNGLLSYFSDTHRSNPEIFFRSIFVVLTTLSLGLIGIYYLLETVFSLLDYSNISLGKNKYLLLIFVFLIIPSSIGDYVFFLKKQYGNVVKFSAFFSGATLFSLIIPLLLGFSLHHTLMVFLSVYALKYAAVFFMVTSFNKFSILPKEIKSFAYFSFPLILYAFLGLMMEYFDSWLVSIYFDESMFVKFRYGAKELPFSALLVSGVTAAMIPLYIENRKLALNKMLRDVNILIPILFIAGSALMLLSPFVFTYLYDSSFILSAKIFNIYVLVLLSRIILPNVFFYANKKNWLLMIFGLGEFVANILLSIYLLKVMGILGIAWATVIVYFLHTMALVVYAKVFLDESLSHYLNLKRYTLYAGVMVCTFILTQFIY